MQRYFYAAINDLAIVVEAVQAQLPLQYTPMGLFREAPRNVAALTPLLSTNDLSSVESYLVSDFESPVRARSVPQDAGGILFAIDQLENPDTIELTPSAWPSPHLAIRGRIATVSDTDPAKRIYRAFARAIEQYFRQVNAAWVGPDAALAWRGGARLAIGPASPHEYDLKESGVDAV